MDIKIFTTGGTIDGLEYSSLRDDPKNEKTLIGQLLQQSNVTVRYSVEMLFSKDSKFIDEKDRKLILQKCIEAPENNIIITHGTVTMAETGRFIATGGVAKTIILTGAMTPSDKAGSDSLFNLGSAFIAAQLLPNGVYIIMNGRIFDSANVQKNKAKGIFETLR